MQSFEAKDEQGRIILPDIIGGVYYKVVEEKDIVNFYFNHNGKTFFFKSNSEYTLDVCELLSNALSDEVGIESVKMMPAVCKYQGETLYGVLSEDFVKNRKTTEKISGKELVSRYEKEQDELSLLVQRKIRYNTIEHHLSALKEYKEEIPIGANYSIKLDSKIPNKLKKQLLFSYLIANQDCYEHNIEYMIEKDKSNVKTIKLAPLFDNSMSFLLKSFKYNINKDFSNFSEDKKIEEVENILEIVNCPFQVKKSSHKTMYRLSISKEIAYLINNDMELQNIFNKIKKMNLKKLFSDYRNKNNFNFITNQQIEIASMVVESSARMIEAALYFERVPKKSPINFLRMKSNEVNLEL